MSTPAHGQIGQLSMPHVVMVVANDVTSDARVKKTAASAASHGCRVTIVGFDRSNPRTSRMGPVTIVRVRPTGLDLLKTESAGPLSHMLAFRSKNALLRAQIGRKSFQTQLASRISNASRRPNKVSGYLRPVARGAARLEINSWRLGAYARELVFQIRRAAYDGSLNQRWRETLGSRFSLRVNAVDAGLPHLRSFEVAAAPVLDELQPDILYAHDFFAIRMVENAAARARLAGRKVPWIYDAHELVTGLEFAPPRQRAAEQLEAAYIRRADAVVTVTHPLAGRLQSQYQLEEQPVVLINAPSGEAFDRHYSPTLREVIGLAGDVPLWVYSGTAKPARGLDTAVRALSHTESHHLAIVTNNSGQYINEISTLAAELGCSERMHFAPYVPAHEVSSFLASASIGIHPLRSSGNAVVALPNKVFEYLHARIPVVAADHPAMRELINNEGIGRVFSPDDPEDMAKCIREVLDSRDAYVTRVVRRELLERFSWEAQEEALIALLSRLLGEELPATVAVSRLDEEDV